ncbi:MAG TPA: YbaK/EbsC family protein [Gaiellaceae bacterium]|nr:YbaK/EbsC family protein [Gaiellaceae bacterium]
MIAQEVHPARGDVVEVSGRRVGDPGRKGEILEVLGSEEHPHYLVRWEDEHESVLYPSEGTTIHSKAPRKRQRKPKLDVAAATAQLVEHLREESVEFELLPHRRTVRAAAEARVLGVLAQTVAKTLVARDPDGRHIRAVVPATARLSLDRLAQAIGVKSVRLLTESELVSVYPQFELGAVPPFGGPAGDLTVIDGKLAECDHVVLEAGVHDTSLRLRTEDLIRISDAQLAEVAAG